MNKKRTSFVRKLFLIAVYQCLFVWIAMALVKRIGAFGCFDDCFNFGAGYFLLHGKQLYSQIFFNHQPFMAYISAMVQYVSNPQTLFELVKYHRIFVLLLADISGTFLILRFGVPLLFPLMIFEATKFYIFGDRFLAEGIIVYPMMYITLLIIYKTFGKIVYRWEYILAAVCSWFIFWMREPFMPWSVAAALMLYAVSHKEKKLRKTVHISLIIFSLMHIGTVLLLPVGEYVFNVITTNAQREVAVQPWSVSVLFRILLYPVFAVYKGTGNPFQTTLYWLSIIYIGGAGYEIVRKKRYLAVGITFVLLSLANLRVVPVGTIYYDAFHMIPWYGLMIGLTAIFIQDMREDKKARIVAMALGMIMIIIFLYDVFSPATFFKEHVDAQSEFTTNYANYFAKGQVIKLLSQPGDTMFVEMWEDPVYFVAGVPTAYRYSWYTSIMPFFPKYQTARAQMFASYPPTFYVGACKDGEADSFALDGTSRKKYVQMLFDNKPACVYISKEKYMNLSQNQIYSIGVYGYSVPGNYR